MRQASGSCKPGIVQAYAAARSPQLAGQNKKPRFDQRNGAFEYNPGELR